MTFIDKNTANCPACGAVQLKEKIKLHFAEQCRHAFGDQLQRAPTHGD